MHAVSFRVATIDELRQRGAALFELHGAELAPGRAVRPNWNTYTILERAGALSVVIAETETDLVGYAVTSLTQHPHFEDGQFDAHNDALFLAPQYRHGGNGHALVREAELAAAAQGASRFYWHAQVDTPLDALLAREHKLHARSYVRNL